MTSDQVHIACVRDLAVVGLKSQHSCTSSLACIGFCSLVHPPALCCCFQLGMCITHCLLNWLQGLQEFVNSTSTSLLQLVCMHKFQTSLQHLALVQTLFALGPSLHYWGLYLVAPSLHPRNPPSGFAHLCIHQHCAAAFSWGCASPIACLLDAGIAGICVDVRG